jgi:hypothetical protein
MIGLVTAAAHGGGDPPSDAIELPKLNFQDYKATAFIEAAVALQALGKEKACELLRANGKGSEHNANNGVIVLMRMLFVKKADGEFRRPRIGGAIFLGGTDYADWPLEPIELIDGVPFLISRGYMIGGGPGETGEAYLDYCLKNCDWNDFVFEKPSEKELRRALVKLVSSPKWKTPLDGSAKDHFAAQIK